MKLLHDLRRRRVFRLAGLYIVGAWIVIEVASVLFPAWGIPDTALRYLVIAAIALFPAALLFGWVFDITSDGIVRTRAVVPGEHVDLSLQRSDYWILAALGVVCVAVVAGSLQKISEEIEEAPVAPTVAERIANSVAVLPFANLDANPDTGYFSDGVTEEILHRLSSLDALHVLGRTSSFAFRDSTDGPARISELLGVKYLLHGSVRRDANIVRVTARLLDETGLQVWSESFDRKLEGIFTIQSEIASTVANQIANEIIPLSEQPLARTTSNMEAYNRYLVGRAFVNSRTPGWQEQAENAFREAIHLDPQYAPPYAGLSVALSIQEQDEEGWTEALAAAEEALELDPGLAEAHAAKGLVLYTNPAPDLEGATVSLRQALALDPSLSIAYNWLAATLRLRGLREESEAVQDQGLSIDPLNPSLSVNIASREMRRGNADYAEQLVMRLTYLPNPPGLAYWELMGLYTDTGQYDKAAEVIKDAIRAYAGTPNMIPISALTWTYQRLQMKAEVEYWSQRQAELTQNPMQRYMFTAYTRKLNGISSGVVCQPEFVPAKEPSDFRKLPPFITAIIAACNIMTGQVSDGIAIFEASFDIEQLDALNETDANNGYEFMHTLAYGYQQVGEDDKATALLIALEESLRSWLIVSEASYSPGLEALALNKLLQRDFEAALEFLGYAIDSGWNNYQWVITDALWQEALARPDFQELLDTVRTELARQRAVAEQANAVHDFKAEFEALYGLEPLD